MGRKKGSSLLETKRRNRVYIKDTIFKMEPITRMDIAEELGLTLPTITTSVNEMMVEGIVEEIPLPAELLSNTAGRRPVGIGLVANAKQVIGVELGPYATRIVLMNLRGKILESIEAEPGTGNYQEMTGKLARYIEEIKKKANEDKLLGIGIGLPGFIEGGRGVIRSHREKDWIGRYLAKDMEKLTKLPVLIDNNVRLRAIGYEMELRRKRPDSFAYFYISKGIACPLMAKDSVLSGYTSGAGEVGHTIICVSSSGRLEQKCVDELAGEAAIFEACREKMEAGGASVLRKLVEEAGYLGMKQVIQAQEDGDEEVCKLVRERIEYLGIALANVVNLVSPDFVVVDGYLLKNEENRRCLMEASRNRFFGINEEEVKIIFRPFEHYNGAKGAGYQVIRKMFLQK